MEISNCGCLDNGFGRKTRTESISLLWIIFLLNKFGIGRDIIQYEIFKQFPKYKSYGMKLSKMEFYFEWTVYCNHWRKSKFENINGNMIIEALKEPKKKKIKKNDNYCSLS